jgi:type I restriction-modification system DNA methylase subunit
MKIAPWSLGILLILPVGFAAGQSQTPPPPQQQDAPSSTTSLTEAAKRAREAKKDDQKPPRVWDNDTVPKAGAQISVVGEAPAATDTDNSAAGASADSSPNGAAQAKSPAKSGGEDKSRLKSQLADAKEKLSTIKTDLDLLERTYTLDSQMYYGKPDYSSDTQGAAKLKAEQEQIAAKQQEMDDQQKKIDDLEAELAKVAPPASEDNSNSN